LADKTPPSDY
jgi:hypothetical protein